MAAARGGTRAGRGERARLRAGLGSWKPGLELAGVREGELEPVGVAVGPAQRFVTGPGVPSAAPEGAGALAAARGLESEFQASERRVRKRRRESKLLRERDAALGVEQSGSPQPSLVQSSSVLRGIPPH